MAKLQDEITIFPPSSTGQPSHKRILIFFICGNPGLIEYYHAFLLQVRRRLQANGHGDNATIYGASHDGFEIEANTRRTALHDPPYSLQEEIEGVKRRLQAKTRDLAGTDPEEPLQVVLMGHSVGAYMLMEVLAWWQKHKEEQAIFSLVGGVCLFPTVVDIAKSPRGRVLSVCAFVVRIWLYVWLTVRIVGTGDSILADISAVCRPAVSVYTDFLDQLAEDVEPWPGGC